MKKAYIIPGMIPVLAGVYFIHNRNSTPSLPGNPSSPPESAFAVKMDPAEVFKRALWRRPDPEDQVLHAERREWTKGPADAADRWQWFLAVHPGDALRIWLRDENPFSTRPAASGSIPAIQGAPEWFPRDFSSYEIHVGGPRGGLIFLFDRDGKTLFATSSGTGAAGPAQSPQPIRQAGPTPDSSTGGRLPLTPPNLQYPAGTRSTTASSGAADLPTTTATAVIEN